MAGFVDLSDLHTQTDESMDKATPFTKDQFKAIIQRYENIMAEMEPREELQNYRSELYVLLQKFRGCYTVQTEFARKVKELQSNVSILRNELCAKTKILEDTQRETEKEIREINTKVNEALVEKGRLLMELASHKSGLNSCDSTAEDEKLVELRSQLHLEQVKFERETMALKTKISLQEEEIYNLELRLTDAKNQLAQTKNDLKLTKEELLTETRRKIKLNKVVHDIKSTFQTNKSTIEVLSQSADESTKKIHELKSSLKQVEKTSKDQEQQLRNVSQKLEHSEKEVESETNKRMDLLVEKSELNSELKTANEKNHVINEEILTLSKENIVLRKQVTAFQFSLSTFVDRENAKSSEISRIENILEKRQHMLAICKKENQLFKAQADDAIEKNLQDRNTIQQLKAVIKTKDEARTFLHHELLRTKHSFEQLKTNLKVLGKEKNTFRAKAEAYRQQKYDDVQKIKNLQMELELYEKEMSELKLVIQKGTEEHKTIFDQSKKNAVLLTELKKQLEDEKNKYYRLDLYSQSLKHINNREVGTISHLRKNMKTLESQNNILREIGENREIELKGHVKELHHRDEDLNKLKKEVSVKCEMLNCARTEVRLLTNRQRLLNSKVDASKNQIDLLSEKIRLMQQALDRGERTYQTTLDDIRLLRIELLHCKTETNCLQKEGKLCHDLKRELIKLKTILNAETLRRKGLELYMQRRVHDSTKITPRNTDAHVLQKKLLRQSNMLNHKDIQLKEKDEIIQKLMVQSKKVPLSVQRSLMLYRNSFGKQKDKTDSLTAQLNMYETYIAQYKEEIVHLRKRLANGMTNHLPSLTK